VVLLFETLIQEESPNPAAQHFVTKITTVQGGPKKPDWLVMWCSW